MRITADRKALLPAVRAAAKIVNRKSTIPVQTHLLIEAGERLTITADNMDLRLTLPVPAEVQRAGTMTAEAETFLSIVSRLPESVSVTLDLGDEGRATLKAGRSRFVVPTLDPTAFPDHRSQPWSNSFTLPAATLRRLIEQAATFISTSETHHYLNGICLAAAEHEGRPVLRSYATDGYRLIRHLHDLPEGAEGLPSFILPQVACTEIARLASEGDLRLDAGDRMVAVTFADGTVLTTKLIDGTYPDCERIIPRNNDTAVRADRDALMGAIDRVMAIGEEKKRGVKLTFEPELMRLESTTDRGEAAEEIEVENATAFVAGINAKFMRETLAALDGDRIDLTFDSGNARGVVLTAFERPSPLCVVMPIRV